ncbi:hypothetical protein VTN49DRAFT_7281 [Thermomyces lanuginosus]|uniref:uncharacterized protein n=1 Tax=Thermomyces lanuginosus TaxID=5541 RepID=UPI0037444C6F
MDSANMSMQAGDQVSHTLPILQQLEQWKWLYFVYYHVQLIHPGPAEHWLVITRKCHITCKSINLLKSLSITFPALCKTRRSSSFYGWDQRYLKR